MSHIVCHDCGGDDHVTGYGFGCGLFGGYTVCECGTTLELHPDTEDMPDDHAKAVAENLARWVEVTNMRRAAKGLPLLGENGRVNAR